MKYCSYFSAVNEWFAPVSQSLNGFQAAELLKNYFCQSFFWAQSVELHLAQIDTKRKLIKQIWRIFFLITLHSCNGVTNKVNYSNFVFVDV